MTPDISTRSEALTDKIPAWTLALAAIIAFQTGAAVSKDVMTPANAMGLLFLRLGLGAIIILAGTGLSVGHLARDQWRSIVYLGLALAAANASVYLALEALPVGLVATIGFLGPLSVSLAGAKRATDTLWPLLGFLGVVLITPWTGSSDVSLNGLALGLLFAASWAAYIVTSSWSSKSTPGVMASGLAMALATLLVAPLGFATAPEFLTSGQSISLVVLITIFSSLPFVLEYLALKRLKPSVFGVLMSTEPAVGALAGLILLGEHLSAAGWAALALVSTASIGATLTSANRPLPEKH